MMRRIELSPALATLDLHSLGPRLFHKAGGISNRVLGVHMIGTVGHVDDQQGVLHAAPHRPRMVQHFVHGDGEGIFVAEHGLRQGIAHQDNVDPSFVHQTRSGIVVGRNAGDGFVTKLFPPQDCGGNFLARFAKRNETHDFLQCPSAIGGWSLSTS